METSAESSDRRRRARPSTGAAVAAVVLAVLEMAGSSIPARASAARSGTITSGVLTTSPAWGCGAQPECLPWLESGCNPALAGRDPAWMSSIVSVAEMADGSTPRTIVIRRGSPTGRYFGGAYVQFWRRDCTEVTWTSWHSFWDCGARPSRYRPNALRPRCDATWTADPIGSRLVSVRTRFPIPRGVAWMTVSANDNVNLVWTIS
jgi:hypothetical protein